MSIAFDLESARAILARTPVVLDTWLRDLPQAWLTANEGPDTWSPYDIVGHLIHGEKTDWIPRARIILEHGDSQPFEPFDRFAQLRQTDQTMVDRLEEFARLRRTNLRTLDDLRLTSTDLERRGRHPELGSVTLGQLLATWTAHDLNHVVQIARVMARRYETDVGAWRDYLGVMR